MAEHNVNEHAPVSGGVETTDRGLFDFMKKKEDTTSTTTTATTLPSEFDQKVQVSEPVYKKEEEYEKKEEKHGGGGLVEKFHRSNSSSSSSSEDEKDDEEKKRKKREKKEKKGLTEKIKEKLPGHHDKEEDTNVPIETSYEVKSHPHGHVHESHPHVQEVVYSEPSHVTQDHEKKGFVDKIKDKLSGEKKADDHHHDTVVAHPVVAVVGPGVEAEGKDKKGFLDKIKDKIPGLSSKTGEDKKEYGEK